MKYRIYSMANPGEFVKNGHLKIHPWIPNGRYCIKIAPVKDGFGEYISFPVEVSNFETKKINSKLVSFADISIDTEQYEWNIADRILIVDDKVWLEAIEGGLKWFHVDEVSG